MEYEFMCLFMFASEQKTTRERTENSEKHQIRTLLISASATYSDRITIYLIQTSVKHG